MEESNHPLGMTVLEIQDTVAGYESLNEEVKQKLMTAEDLSTLPPDLQRRVLGQIIPSSSWLAAEVDGSAVLVTDQWIVSIHGDSLAHCIAALVKYRNAVATRLDTAVTGELHTPFVVNTGPLSEVATRREQERRSQRRFRDNVKMAIWTLAGAVAGFVMAMLGRLLMGG